MKNRLNIIMVGLLVTVSILAGIKSYELEEMRNAEPETVTKIEYVYIESDPEVITEYVYLPSTQEFFRSFTDREAWCLKDLAMREGANQGVIGQCWIMYTAICRAETYGISIEQVWASYAFKTSMSMSGKTPNEDCNKAFAMIEEGWIPKPLWFRTTKYHSFGNPLCKVGDHYFSAK